jgi:hypothetical protein
MEYLVKWKGLSDNEASWEPGVSLLPFADKIEEYLAKKSTRASTWQVGECVTAILSSAVRMAMARYHWLVPISLLASFK